LGHGVSPKTGFPRAVWSARGIRGMEIVSSFFNGRTWSRPLPIHVSGSNDAVDPKIAFTPSGTAIVVWWESGASPVVRMSFLTTRTDRWTDAGVISDSGEKAKEPSLLQNDDVTIIAYRTPAGIKIITRGFAELAFGDGPTPFPHSDPNLP
jgi:hypothetical protein